MKGPSVLKKMKSREGQIALKEKFAKKKRKRLEIPRRYLPKIRHKRKVGHKSPNKILKKSDHQ